MVLQINKLPNDILIGRQTENGVNEIEIDVSEWLEHWPGMNISIMHTRPGETYAYPAATHMTGSCIVWEISNADTAIHGLGTVEIMGILDGKKKLSRIVQTHISKTTTATTSDIPEAAKPWVDMVINAANEIKGMTAEAETLQPGNSATASYADGKLSLGIPKGDKGDKGDPGAKGDPGSDANVTAENIQSALGYAPVKDIRVSGNSVLANGVANIPIASNDEAGVIKSDAYTIGVNPDGHAFIYNSQNADIANRTTNIPMTAYNLDYAVKTAMCDGKGAAWTADEQDAARERIGVDKPFELIEKIVLQEETSSISRELSLEALYLEIVTSDLAEADSKAQYVTVGIDGIQYSVYLGQTVKAGQVRYAKILAERKHGRYMITAYQPGNLTQALTMHFQHNAVGIVGDKITKIRIHEAQLPAGTEISIYGVSA